MTATLVARLAEQGVISWDDTVEQHLGAVIPEMNPAYAELTFRHLLSHRAGLRANVGMMDMIRFGARGADGEALPPQRIEYAEKVLASRSGRDAGNGIPLLERRLCGRRSDAGTSDRRALGGRL